MHIDLGYKPNFVIACIFTTSNIGAVNIINGDSCITYWCAFNSVTSGVYCWVSDTGFGIRQLSADQIGCTLRYWYF